MVRQCTLTRERAGAPGKRRSGLASLWVSTVKPDRAAVDVRCVRTLGTATAAGTEDSSSVPRAAAVPDRPVLPPSQPASPRLSVRSAAPQRCDELAHMTLARLRAYRRTLLGEELSTSYWRRLLQARRDLLRHGGAPGDHRALREALTEVRGASGRQAILALHPSGGMPILPHLPDLWATQAPAAGSPEARELTTRLTSAETVLSSYREALHRRLDRATADLVARYHEDPGLCSLALPTAD